MTPLLILVGVLVLFAGILAANVYVPRLRRLRDRRIERRDAADKAVARVRESRGDLWTGGRRA